MGRGTMSNEQCVGTFWEMGCQYPIFLQEAVGVGGGAAAKPLRPVETVAAPRRKASSADD